MDKLEKKYSQNIIPWVWFVDLDNDVYTIYILVRKNNEFEGTDYYIDSLSRVRIYNTIDDHKDSKLKLFIKSNHMTSYVLTIYTNRQNVSIDLRRANIEIHLFFAAKYLTL